MMGSCDKHGNVQCRFLCKTCSVPVCYVCMEGGDHVIPEHQCIPLSQYCEKKSNEINAVLLDATHQKSKYDQIKLKWDTHLGSLEGEFGKLKTEIRLAKQNLLQQMDHAEQSLLKTAGIAKTRREITIESAKVSHEQGFSGTYQQLNEKCQSLLWKLSNQNFADEHAFQECHNLLNILQEKLTIFGKEDLLGMNFTFIPSKNCFLGEVIVPGDAAYMVGSKLELPKSEGSERPVQKRRRTETEIKTPVIKQEHENLASTSNDGDRSSSDIKTAEGSTSEHCRSNQAVSAGSTPMPGDNRSSLNVDIASTSTSTATTSSNSASTSTSTATTRSNSGPFLQSPIASRPVASLPPVRTSLSVDSRCNGIFWADNDWLIEVSTAESVIVVKHHRISGRGHLHPNVHIKCSQSMEGVQIHVCPKLHSPDFSFVVAFSDQVAIIRLKGSNVKDTEVSWKRIPKGYSILAISWRQIPSNFVAIVKGQDGKRHLMRITSGKSGKAECEVKVLTSIDFNRCHPFDISSNSELAICSTLSDRILFFSGLGELIPTKQVAGPPCLTDAKPISVLVRDGKKEWLALWKGKSPSGRQFKWAVVRYNVNFVPSTTVVQCFYTNSHTAPKAFSAYEDSLAVLHNNLQVVFYHGLSTMSQ